MKMTKRFLAFSIWILLFVLLHQANSGPNDPVNIPDPVLRAAIENRLGKTAGDTITESELNSLTGTLNARSTTQGGRVMQLTGLEHATSVTQMVFQNARITDLSPLAGLTQLQYLDVRNNGTIVNLSPLSGLTGLQKLYLRKNKKIVDISSLSGLTALTVLALAENQIADISPLKNLTNLTELGLSENRGISDISILKGLTKLEILGLNYVNITQEGLAAVLPSFSALRSLVIGQTNITDLSVLRDLPSSVILENLDLIQMGPSSPLGWHLKDLSPLVSLMNEGRVVSSKTVGFNLRWNFGLDYESLYTDIPALIAGTTSQLAYSTDITPKLEGVSAENHVGRPGTVHTFVVQASNTTVYPPGSTDADAMYLNDRFEKVPVTFTVTAPDGTIETHPTLLTGADGLASVAITLGNDGETHIVEAVVPAKQNTDGPSHGELRVRFTATADGGLRLGQLQNTGDRLKVTFEDYPEEKPTDEFTLTLKFSEPVIGFEKNDISLETELTRGTGTATLEALTPLQGPAQTYIARIGVPSKATGTVKLIVLADAAIGTSTEGPAEATDSDPISFGADALAGKRIPPSKIAMDRIIFNEFRNAPDDKNDWLELKNISDEPVSLKDWEVSQVLPHAVRPAPSQLEPTAMDRDIVTFPNTMLPPGGVLLIVNTGPRETDLIRGQDITAPDANPDRFPQYLVAPEMKLPRQPHLLILRSVRDKNGTPEAVEDVVGNYFESWMDYATNIWPLGATPWNPAFLAAPLTDEGVYARILEAEPSYTVEFPLRLGGTALVTNVYESPFTAPYRGYLAIAWQVSGYNDGIGYDPQIAKTAALGTPGYPRDVVVRTGGTGQISFSEVMCAPTAGQVPLPQWIELYNNSSTEVVDLEGWTLNIEGQYGRKRLYLSLELKPFSVLPNATVVLVTGVGRNSGHFPEGRVYDLSVHHLLEQSIRDQKQLQRQGWLSATAFGLKLLDRDGVLIDAGGNLDGEPGRETPVWSLPVSGIAGGVRRSLVRRYTDGVATSGGASESWRVSASGALEVQTYWGNPSDIGTPLWRKGGVLPVALSSFRADRTAAGVVVKWTTASETGNAGFNLLRSETKEGVFVKVNPVLILGAGTTAEGQSYTYQDTTAGLNTAYVYRLEEVSLSGVRSVVATVRLRGHLSAANKVLWKWADVKIADDADEL